MAIDKTQNILEHAEIGCVRFLGLKAYLNTVFINMGKLFVCMFSLYFH